MKYYLYKLCCIVMLFLFLVIIGCGGSDSTAPAGTAPNINLTNMQLSTTSLDTSVNDGMFDLSWSVSLQSDLNAYYVWFYIIPINDVSSSSFDDGEYTGEGVEISSWGYNTPHTSVTHQFQYIASTNSISYSDTLSVKNRPLGSITDNAYVLLCVQTMNSLGQYDYAYDTCYISLVPETLNE